MLGVFFRKKERWTLTLWGWLMALGLLIGVVVGVARGLYPFLAVSRVTYADILVVEGWIHSDSVEQVAQAFQATSYKDMVVVAAVTDAKSKWDSGRYKAEYIAGALESAGVPKDCIQVIYCDAGRKDRTYSCARTVREWLHKREKPVQAIDVVTIGPHARRSRLLFKKAMGSTVRVGVLAMDEREYDPVHWWRSSEGIREVLFEGVAYIYAKWFFVP
jgi:uncharacterized SAM-binding protein YcdF (DUF218 family)